LTKAQEEEFLNVVTTTERITQFQKVHQIIAESCQNHFYEAISKSMLRLTFEVVEAVDPDHEALHMPGEHQQIIDAIIGNNAKAAQAQMKTHMEKFCKSLLEMETAYRQKVMMAV
jgi:DNA-binding FadR family transcriptional regulator